MKTQKPLSLLFSCLALSALPFAQAKEIKIPTGKIIVDRERVRSEETAKLSWSITHPRALEEDVDENLKLKTKQKVIARMIGTAVSSRSKVHYGTTYTLVDLGDGWKTLYEGKGEKSDIKNTNRLRRNCSEGTIINFAAYYKNWQIKGDKTVLILKRGDLPPSKAGGNGAKSLADYIAPYVNKNTGRLDIGERDLMLAAELTHSWSDRYSSGYDSNDSIAMFTFKVIQD